MQYSLCYTPTLVFFAIILKKPKRILYRKTRRGIINTFQGPVTYPRITLIKVIPGYFERSIL